MFILLPQKIVQQKTARLDDAHTRKELTKDTVELDNYLLNRSYQGIFWINVPLKSTRLKLMMPNSPGGSLSLYSGI